MESVSFTAKTAATSLEKTEHVIGRHIKLQNSHAPMGILTFRRVQCVSQRSFSPLNDTRSLLGQTKGFTTTLAWKRSNWGTKIVELLNYKPDTEPDKK